MARLSTYFLPTLREDPADAEAVSHRLMVRAGLIRQLGAGLWTWLPGGYRIVKRVEAVIREEIDAIGGQEMLMPVLQPAEPWKRTGRYDIDELFKLADRKGSEHVLAMTNEEAVTFHVGARDPLLPRAAEDPLPPAGQGARRAAPARGRAAHPRVHDEGLLLARPRRRGARRELRAAPSRLRPHPRPLRAALVRGRIRRRDDGRDGRPRVHGPVRRGRGRGRPRSRLRRQPRGRLGGGAAGRAAAGARRAARGADARADHRRRRIRGARGGARRRAEGDAGDRRGAGDGARAGPRRPPPQRDQASQRPRRRLSPGHARGDRGRARPARVHRAGRRPGSR